MGVRATYERYLSVLGARLILSISGIYKLAETGAPTYRCLLFLLILTPPECPVKPAVDLHTPTVIQNVCGRTLNLSLCVFFFCEITLRVPDRPVSPSLRLCGSVFVSAAGRGDSQPRLLPAVRNARRLGDHQSVRLTAYVGRFYVVGFLTCFACYLFIYFSPTADGCK